MLTSWSSSSYLIRCLTIANMFMQTDSKLCQSKSMCYETSQILNCQQTPWLSGEEIRAKETKIHSSLWLCLLYFQQLFYHFLHTLVRFSRHKCQVRRRILRRRWRQIRERRRRREHIDPWCVWMELLGIKCFPKSDKCSPKVKYGLNYFPSSIKCERTCDTPWSWPVRVLLAPAAAPLMSRVHSGQHSEAESDHPNKAKSGINWLTSLLPRLTFVWFVEVDGLPWKWPYQLLKLSRVAL